MIGYGNSMFLATHGILARTASGGGVDPDAQAFITAASITDPTQQSAINQLVVDLKGYSIWSKMKALYPFVGGTAAQHKWNLKDPRDLDAAFRILWNGGVNHSANGITGNQMNAYGDTRLNNQSVLNNNNKHISIYQRNILPTISNASMGITNTDRFYLNYLGSNFSTLGMNQSAFTTQAPQQGMFTMSKIASGSFKYYQNNLTPVTKTGADINSNLSYVLLASNSGPGNIADLSIANLAFASIGDGLTDTEAANFHTAVQAFQTTLGRSIGTQTVSDADAQAFVTAAGIVDQVEADAINNLVIGIKADSLWTKMKAVYPMVGGTSTSTSYNLRNTAQYQISWNGGWTWNSNGVTGNGVNGWGNTGLIPNSALTLNSTHQSLYIRNTGNLGVDDFGSATNATTSLMRMIVKNSGTNDHIIDHYAVAQRITGTVADSTGFFVVSRENSTSLKSKRNDVSLGTNTNSNTGTLPTHALYLGALNNIGTAVNYTARNYAFASAGDGLSDTDMTNLRNRVVTFQTALNRNV